MYKSPMIEHFFMPPTRMSIAVAAALRAPAPMVFVTSRKDKDRKTESAALISIPMFAQILANARR